MQTTVASFNFKLMRRDLTLGFKAFRESLSFIGRHGLRHYFLYPFILMLVQLALAIWLIIALTSGLAEPIFSSYSVTEPSSDTNFWQDLLYYLSQAGETIFKVLVFGVMLYLVIRINKYVMLTLLSPLLAWLSETAEYKLTGNDYPFSVKQFFRDLWRGLLLSVRNFAIEMAIGLLATILTFFLPIIAPLTVVALFLVSSYFYGFAVLDYIAERMRLNVGDSARFVRDRRGVAMSIGGIFALGMYVPLVGPVMMPVMATVAAVLALKERGDLDSGEDYRRIS